jgi:NAD(P)-dependent dehydrogenase (short-subunit alcohol dehydrogenase family)
MTKRTCLLTGASGLFGTAFIRRFASRYRIIAVHHRGEIAFPSQHQSFFDPLEPAREVAANEHAVHAIRADLATPEGVDATAREAASVCDNIDLVIHAAARRSFRRLLQPAPGDDSAPLFALNVLAPLRLSVALANAMWRRDPDANARERRNVVNLSSTAGLFVYQDLGQSLYAASKAALNHLTYHMASELWDIGVRVNAVAPDTFPGRVTIDEVLDAVVALDESDETGRLVPLYREGLPLHEAES